MEEKKIEEQIAKCVGTSFFYCDREYPAVGGVLQQWYLVTAFSQDWHHLGAVRLPPQLTTCC